MTSGPPPRPPLDGTRLVDLPGPTRVEVVPATPSTNALVAERARGGEPEGLVVVAEHQTAGRGRLDRVWETPDRAALTFSVLLRPAVLPARWPWLPLLTGLAVAGALREQGFEAGVKWPNDVLLGPRGTTGKIAGILVERVETRAGAAAVLGIGLNVSTTRAELPIAAATSLLLAGPRSSGEAPDRTALLATLLARLWEQYDGWRRDRPGAAEELRTAYARACVTVGRTVRVLLPGGSELTGEAAGIDAGGRLLVGGPDGEVAVGAGDVVHVR